MLRCTMPSLYLLSLNGPFGSYAVVVDKKILD